MIQRYDDVSPSAALVIENGVEFDRWIIGDAVDTDREYVIHLSSPKFLAKFLDGGGADDDESDAILSEVSIHIDGIDFYDFLFIDTPPDQTELVSVLREAHAAITRYSFKD
jgi:hypothetical protein